MVLGFFPMLRFMETSQSNSWIKIFNALFENQKRWLAAQKANELGRGGIAEVMALTGLSRNTIKKGMQELKSNQDLNLGGRVRRTGAGRKTATETTPKLLADIEKIINGSTAGALLFYHWISFSFGPYGPPLLPPLPESV